MYARTFITTARCARASPLKQTATRRFASTTPAPEEKKGGNGLLFAALATAAAGAGGYYYYTTQAATPLPPAEPTLKGDNEWVDLKLAEIHQVSPNTKRFRFELPSENHVSGMRVTSALLTKYKGPNDAKPTIRPYTPVTDEEQRGYMDLLVKKYENGPMSTHLHDMNVDQRLAFKGPLPKYPWEANKHEHITCIAGGTGITPMYQLIRAIFNNPEDKTKVTLVFGNVSEQDILLKKEFQDLENTYPQRFRAFYTLENPPKDSVWANKGYISKDLLKTVLPEPESGNNKIFVCGPPGMYKAISGGKKSPKDQGELSGILKELGYKADDVFKF